MVIGETKNMKNCKFYSEYLGNHCENGLCHFAEEMFGDLPQSCNHVDDFENCSCFKPTEHKLDFTGAKIVKLNIDENRVIGPRTLIIQNCDKIILKPRSLEVEVKIEKDNFDDFDYIVVNGHKFKRI